MTTSTQHTIATYFGAFSSTHTWSDLCTWPPDVFALTNLVLDHTEAYRFAVSPPSGKRWPPTPNWDEMVVRAGEEWRNAAGRGEGVDGAVSGSWGALARHKGVSLESIRSGQQPEIVEALLTLHAMADEACRGLAWPPAASPDRLFEQKAWDLLRRRGSLSRIDPTRVRITPKTHSASRGITIRSLSRYLALSYEAIEVHWRRVPVEPVQYGPREYRLLLAPWPLKIESGAFRPTQGPLENMDRSAFGFFRFEPGTPLDLEQLAALVRRAFEEGPVDALFLPEGAVSADEVPAIQDLMNDLGVHSLFLGVRGSGLTPESLGQNFVLASIGTNDGWMDYRQDKHHRWCLDASQIRQYHLSKALSPSRLWWEAIELPPRTLEVIDVGGGTMITPLVCEDLARMDEVADLVRRIGPSLVVALLLDGPQLPTRWPCRYASVLADEPGSAVLTLSSLGMVARSQPPGKPRSRVVALWSDPDTGTHEIELARGASGVVLTTSVELKTVWTADGRRHESNTPSLRLESVQQVRIPHRSTGSPHVRSKSVTQAAAGP